MKKMLFVLTMLLAAAGFLFAAGQADGTKETTEMPELIWYFPGGPFTDSAPVYEALNELFVRDLGFTVDFKPSGGFGEYRETMPLSMAAGDKFDLVWTSSWCNSFLDAATDGLYAPLDDLLQEYAPTIWNDTADSLEATRVNGKIRAVWAQQIAAYTTVVKPRVEMIEEFGWDVSSVKSIRDIEPFLDEIKSAYPDIIPLSTRYPLGYWLTPYLGIASVGIPAIDTVIGVRVDDETVTVFNLMEDPEFITTIELAREWYLKGYIASDGLTYTDDQWTQMSNSGKIGIDVHNTWNPGSEVIQMPFGRYLQIPIGQSYQNTANITSTLNAVSAVSEYREEAVQLLEYLWKSPEAYNLLVWGLSGEHYEELGGGYINPDPDSGYYTNSPWVFGNTFISYLREGQNPESSTLTYELNQNAAKATVMGFVPDMDDIQVLAASVGTVKNQYFNAVLGGYMDPAEELPKFQAALKQAGIDTLIEELQSQVDDWLMTK